MGKALLFPVISTRRVGDLSQPQVNSSKRKPRNGKGKTELHWAVISTNHQRLAELLQQHASPPRRPSVLTTSRGDVSLDINHQDELGRTALHWAVALKDVESAKALLDDPQTDRHSRDKDGRTPLHEAAIRGCDKVVVALLRKHEVDDTTPEQAGVSIQDKYGRTALHWSAEFGHWTITEVLAKQAGCEATDNDDNTALHRAAQRGHEKAVAILADNYANLEPKNKDQKTPFQVAAENEHEEVAWLFLQKRELQSHHESMALFLIQKCPILHKKNELLLWAANAGYADVVQGLLLEKGADVDAKADGGLNPLLIAIMERKTAVVQVLLEQGADVHVKDPAGRTPLMVAYLRQNNAISQLLKSYTLPKPQ